MRQSSTGPLRGNREIPVAALAAAPIRIGTVAPAATANGLAGFEITPEGSALSVI